MAPWCRDTQAGAVITVRVVPRAARTEIQGVLGDALKIRIQAPPVEGKANAELLRFLSDQLGLPRSQIQLLRGDSARNKQILISKTSALQVGKRLGVNPQNNN